MLQPFLSLLDVSRSFAGRMRDGPVRPKATEVDAPDLQPLRTPGIAIQKNVRDSDLESRSPGQAG